MSKHQNQSELLPILDAVEEVTKRCQDHCMGPDGPGGALKAQVERWRGGLSVGVWVASGTLALLTLAVGLLIALAPGIVRSSVAEVTPGVVREELRKAGIAAVAEAKRQAVLAEIPSAPWLINQARAETEGSTP